MQVLKFGGTSVGNGSTIKKVKDIIAQCPPHEKTVVVVSALGGVTDALLQSATMAAGGEECFRTGVQKLLQRHLDTVKELLPVQNQSSLLSFVMQQFNEIENICNGIYLLNDLSERTKDRVLSYGELISSRIISDYFQASGLDNAWVDSRQLIVTDNQFTRASVQFAETDQKIQEYFSKAEEKLFVVPGFVGATANGHTTTLGRGGSDYTAAIIAAALEAKTVEIWTDVSGMMTADPRQVSNARAIRYISYHEAMELSHFGAKVIYPPTIQPLLKKNIPVHIRNTFAPADEGTTIQRGNGHNGSIIRGLSCIMNIALLSLEGSGMIGIPGFSRRLFEVLAAHHINVILITQASSEHSICVGVEEQFATKAKQVIDDTFHYEIEKEKVNPLLIEKDVSIIALVGDHMKSHPGISGRMFSALGRNGVNVRAIAQGSSERNISTVVASKDIRKGLNVLHEEFFETTYKEVNLFIAGTGNVGGKLLSQIAQQQDYLQQHLRLQVHVVGLSNSRHMIFQEEGVDVKNWKELLLKGEKMDIKKFIQAIHARNLRNSVFVDMTASAEVAEVYDRILPKSVAVVACNKIACSSPYPYYRKLKELARDYGTSFFFETNVGASLPIIGTLNDLLRSGDEVRKIDAVLSGTLNYVFNNYNGEKPFAEVVRQAQKEGYTEPDPRLDLSGMDVMRKIMILARESGAHLEMEDISNQSFMPPSCMEGSVDDFYREMEKEEAHFRKLYEEAKKEGKKLKFVASYENGKASVGLKHIDPEHDFFHLYGKDNIVLFYTNRYVDQPMVVKGAGAGAEVTASGVFADILRVARY